jgi:hypothetical protein
MKVSSNLLPRLVSLFFFILVNSLYALDKDKVILEWDNIPFAKEYQVELRNKQGKIFFKKKVSENKIELEISPDDYEKRITVINKLGEVDTTSDWTPFFIRFAEGKIKVIQKWEKVPGSAYYILEIENEQGKIIQRRKTQSEELELGLNPGNYKKRLLVINKLDEIELESEWIPFSVVEIFTPELKDANTKEIITTDKKNPELNLDGFHFEPGIEVLIESGNHKVTISELKIESENKIRIMLNTDDTPPGVYTLKMKNLKSKESSYPQYLKLEVSSKGKILSKEMQNWEILLRSALFAGWGEVYGGNAYKNSVYKKRGYAYGGLFIVSGVYFLKLLSDFEQSSNQLKKDSLTNIALTAAIPDNLDAAKTFMVFSSANQIISNHNSLKNISNESLKVSYVLIGIYLIQLVDAYFINRDINRIYDPPPTGFKLDVTRQISFSNFQKPEENVLLYYKFSF